MMITHTTSTCRWPAVLLAACAGALGWTASASAAPAVSVAAGTLIVDDDTIDETPVTVTCAAGEVRVNTAPAGATCESITSIVITSSGGSSGQNTIELAGAGPADGFTALESTRITAGHGDSVKGSPVRDVITGATGMRVVEGRDGDDDINTSSAASIDAGPGDDVIRGWNTATTPTGGEGRDTAVFDYSAIGPVEVGVSITDGAFAAGAGASEVRYSYASMERVDVRLPGGAQDIDASGLTGSLRLDAGAGDDKLNGGTGADELIGGPGADTITARDGERDTIDCGASTDSVVGDRVDAFTECETVDVPPLPEDPRPDPVGDPEPVADSSAPALLLGRASLRGSRLSLTVTCPAEELRCTGRARLRAEGRRRGRSVGGVTFDMAGGRSQTLVKRLSKRRRRQVARLGRVRLGVRVEVRDAAGNRSTQTARLALRRR